MLTSNELIQMRGTVEASLIENAVVWRRVREPDSAGGFTERYVQVSICPARIVSSETLDKEVASQLRPEATHVLVVPYDGMVLTTDRVTIGARTFEVIAGTVGQTWAIAYRVQVKEILH